MTEKPPLPTIRTQADVEQMWRRLMSPLGFRSCSLWMVVIQGERPVPQITEIVELDGPPDDEVVDSFAAVLGPLASPGARFALLRSRPGGGRPDVDDRAWARALYDAGRRAGARLEVVHLAHDHDVLPMTADDLMAESA
jgi:hypothetical protein